MADTKPAAAVAATAVPAGVGVIIPPPEIKVVVDHTANFIRSKGAHYEQVLRTNNRNNAKFAFLEEANVYHAYYRQRVEFGEDAPALQARDAVTARLAANAEAQAAAKPQKKAARIQTLTEKLVDYMRQVKLSPDVQGRKMPQNEYCVRYPDVYSSLDLDVIQLTAQFVARNGREFLNGLSIREQRNSQFDFLQPTHPLFTFFQQMVQAYSLIIVPPPEVIKAMERKVSLPQELLKELLLRRALREQQLEEERRTAEDSEQERAFMAQIDWQSFVVVQTIDFDGTDDRLLPEPCGSIEEINRMLQAREKADELARERVQQIRAETEFGGDMDVDMEEDSEEDDEDDEEEDGIDLDVMKKKKPTKTLASAADEDEELEVVPDVVDKQDSLARAVRYQTCPVCGDEIPIAEMQEHMRIELLNPEWKENKRRLEEKKRESSLIESQSISRQLKRMAAHRQDVFDEPSKAQQDDSRSPAGVSWLEMAQRQAAEAMREKQDRILQQEPPQPRVPLVAPAWPAQPTMPPPPPPATVPGVGLLAQQQQARLQQLVMRDSGAAPAHPAPVAEEEPPAKRMKMSPPPPSVPPMPGTGFPGMPPMPPAFMPPPPPPMPAAPATAQSEPSAEAVQPEKPGVSEEEWMAQHPGPLAVHVNLPNEPQRGWNLNGGSLKVQVESAGSTVGQLKDRLSQLLLGMPANKMKINIVNGPFLNKDTHTLARYRIASGAQLLLGVRERGGRRK